MIKEKCVYCEEGISQYICDECTKKMEVNIMDAEQQFFSVGLHKGEMDFGVNGSVVNLTYKQMKELREMLVVGIGQLEQMWGRAQQMKNPSGESKSPN